VNIAYFVNWTVPKNLARSHRGCPHRGSRKNNIIIITFILILLLGSGLGVDCLEVRNGRSVS